MSLHNHLLPRLSAYIVVTSFQILSQEVWHLNFSLLDREVLSLAERRREDCWSNKKTEHIYKYV